jgi:hypothetical protein
VNAVEGIILVCMWAVLALRSYVDNSALRACARELKRIADATERSVYISELVIKAVAEGFARK